MSSQDGTRVVVCLDGLDPAYLAAADTPGWDEIAEEGSSGECECAMPSLTNVNNVSIVTGSYPADHGITGNTYYDDSGELVYMEDPEFVRRETRLQAYAEAGETVAALVAKDKLRRMVGRGCDFAASAEDPPGQLVDAVGPAPDIYSGEASPWLLDAALHVLDEMDPDVLYVSTTDVVPHKHAPGEETAKRWVRLLDTGLAALHGRGVDLVATADHGMNHKSVRIDLDALFEREGVDATVVRLIRDKHTYHHQNLGGAAYVYLHEDADVDWLADVDGVDEVLSREAAADRFRLAPNRIGDHMVLGDADSVFGPVEDGVRDAVDLRTHGSCYERTVPFVSTRDVDLAANLEAFAALED